VKINAIVFSGRYGNKSMGLKLMEIKFYKKYKNFFRKRSLLERMDDRARLKYLIRK
jgi:hypothetical protein